MLDPRHRVPVKAGIAVLAAALVAGVLATAYAEGAAGRGPDDAPPPPWFETHPTVIVELRIWQNVAYEENLWVSARPKGGDWDTRGTVPLAWNGSLHGYGAMSKHRFGEIELADVKLRVWQREMEPERIYVEACGACPAQQSVRWGAWRPLGMIPLPLDDGLSRGGYYRYGDMDIAIPHRSPLLLEDREYLLALRDVLAGTRHAELGRRDADHQLGGRDRHRHAAAGPGPEPGVPRVDGGDLGLAGRSDGADGVAPERERVDGQHPVEAAPVAETDARLPGRQPFPRLRPAASVGGGTPRPRPVGAATL